MQINYLNTLSDSLLGTDKLFSSLYVCATTLASKVAFFLFSSRFCLLQKQFHSFDIANPVLVGFVESVIFL